MPNPSLQKIIDWEKEFLPITPVRELIVALYTLDIERLEGQRKDWIKKDIGKRKQGYMEGFNVALNQEIAHHREIVAHLTK